MKTAERHRRVGDSRPRHRSPPPISLPVPNTWQQGARQSSTLLFCGFPHQEFIHEAGGSVEEFNIIFCGRYSYFESRRTLWSASSLRIRARDCATNESMVSATDASRYSIADGSRHSLVRRGGGGGIFRRYRELTIHQANTQKNLHIHKAQIVEGLARLKRHLLHQQKRAGNYTLKKRPRLQGRTGSWTP